MTVNVAAPIVAGFIALLNVVETRVLTGTAVAPFAGIVEITVGAPVVKLHTKLAASALPNVSFAPVVIVAVKAVPGARLAPGWKVAIFVPATYVTCPDTLAPPEVKVNVEVLIVARFIALLKVAVITAVLTTVEPSGGVAEVTLGGVSGSPGSLAFLSQSPHPTTRTASRNTQIQILLTTNLCITSSFNR